VVIELTPVVTLDGLKGEAELSRHPGKEVEGGKRLKLGTQRESPRVVREIINHDQILLTAKETKNRRNPQITVNKITAEVTKPAVPGSGRSRGESSGHRGRRMWSSRSRKPEGLKGPRTVTLEKRTAGHQILHSKPRGVKVD
jgi:hypothetical protein